MSCPRKPGSLSSGKPAEAMHHAEASSHSKAAPFHMSCKYGLNGNYSAHRRQAQLKRRCLHAHREIHEACCCFGAPRWVWTWDPLQAAVPEGPCWRTRDASFQVSITSTAAIKHSFCVAKAGDGNPRLLHECFVCFVCGTQNGRQGEITDILQKPPTCM